MRRHDQLATIRTLASADEGFAPGVTFAAGIASDLTARAQRPHRPVPALDGLTALTRALRSLPLSPSLAISPRMLRHKLMVRGAKDALLKTVIERLCADAPGVVLNPCCVFARHGQHIARRLPAATVVASDIVSTWQRLFQVYSTLRLRRPPSNFRFDVQSVYDIEPARAPLAVVFFGGCGSMTDAAFRLAVGSHARYIVGRACCHENIGMNTTVTTLKFTPWSIGHRVKNRIYRVCADRLGHYGHPTATIDTYPLSRTFRALIDSAGMRRCAQHAVDCRLCQTVIDLDRASFLEESGYTLLAYNENMFVAVRQNGIQA